MQIHRPLHRTLALLCAVSLAGGAWPTLAADTARSQPALSVRSDPSGAEVLIDGQRRGVTPLTLPPLPPGRHRVQIVKEGYLEHSRLIEGDTRPQAIAVRLTRAGVAPAPRRAESPSQKKGWLRSKWMLIGLGAAGAGGAALVLTGGGPAPNPGIIRAPAAAIVTSELQFRAEGASDSTGKTLTYSWDFGDGGKGTGETTTHVYTREGTYEVSLEVSNGSAKATVKTSVRVGSASGTWSGTYSNYWSFSVTLQQSGSTLSGSYQDVDGTGTIASGTVGPANRLTFTVRQTLKTSVLTTAVTATVSDDLSAMSGTVWGASFTAQRQ